MDTLDSAITRDSGAECEGDVFSVFAEDPYVVRSPEFALVDGGIDCSRTYEDCKGHAARWSRLSSHHPTQRSVLVPFDVKSTIGAEAGQQVYHTSPAQAKVAAFYICVAVADPAYVDLIPNYHQDASVLETGLYQPGPDDLKLQQINPIETACLHPKSYGFLSPSSLPYRMPRWMLPEAVKRIRDCALGKGEYVNPWNGVSFKQWQPLTTKEVSLMRPHETNQQFTSHEQAMYVKECCDLTQLMDFEFVGLQPRLADFKLDGRLVQAKFDTEPRSRTAAFDRVPVARFTRINRPWRFFFNTFERFEFLMYQFEYTGLPKTRCIFFIPECELPDDFYQSNERHQNFEQLSNFRIDLDDNMEWLERVREIMREYPEPRLPNARPVRTGEAVVDDEVTHNAVVQVVGIPQASAKVGSRREHYRMFRMGLRRFYETVMDQCAKEGSGALVVLPASGSYGHLGFFRYRWLDAEKRVWWELGHPPRTAHSLSADTMITSIFYCIRYRECNWQGPTLSPAQFRRLTACAQPRLLVVDLAGPDMLEQPLNPAIIPSDDVRPTENQRKVFAGNINVSKWSTNTPHLSALLSTGLFACEYAQTAGPVEYAFGSEHGLWRMIDNFSNMQSFQHPHGFERDPTKYRTSLQQILQELKDSQLEGNDMGDGEE